MARNEADSVAINIEELPSSASSMEEDIDIEKLASSMEKDMASNDPFMSPDCCIFKTPTILCMHNEKAYVPRAFSIGPFHHGNGNLADDTEKIKKKYLHGLISRSTFPKKQLRYLINSVNKLQTQARKCYSKPIGFKQDEFVKILVIDGCFIIELFRKEKARKEANSGEANNQVPGEANQVPREDDPIFSMSCMNEFLYHDLILLENQVPWMVLKRLYNVIMGSDEDGIKHDETLIELAIGYFEKTFSFKPPSPLTEKIIDIKHIPDLIIKWMVSSIDQVEQGPNLISSRREEGWRHGTSSIRGGLCGVIEMEAANQGAWAESQTIIREEDGRKQMPSATSLVEAGIKFKRVTSKSILDIKFKDGVLEIPPLIIQETTETVFRNLISFEQCYPYCEARFTSYAVLIDNLINTAKDVDILCENEIFDNWLNPQDAVPFFNKLYHNTFGNRYYYGSLSRDVNKYCQRGWPRWRAALVRHYLHTPWAIFSAMAAIILLILSLLQTVYTMEK